MAIAEFNEAGGVLGRKIETVWMDTETNPQTGTRVAERMINRENVHFLVGAIQSGVATAIGQVAQQRWEGHTSELQSLMRISYAVSCLQKANTLQRDSEPGGDTKLQN